MSILLAIGFLVGFIGSTCLPVLADTIEIPITGEWKVQGPPPAMPEINFTASSTPVDLSMDVGVTDVSVSRTITNYSVTSRLIFSIESPDDSRLRISNAANFDNNSWITVLFNTPPTNGGYFTNLLGLNRLIWYGGVLSNNTMNLITYPPNLPYGAAIGEIGGIGATNNMIITFEAHRKTDCRASLSGTLRFTVRGELLVQP